MVVFPNAKINLGLHVVSKRLDGYHNLETAFYPVPWTDVLEILPNDKLTFSSSGLEIPGNSENNLCLKAFQLLKEAYDIPNVKIHLRKVIPMGAGLGGGSSDATFTLLVLNELFELNLSKDTLADYAKKLGADCPFFIYNTPSYATGTGTDFTDIQLPALKGYIVLVYPKIHISSGEAYSGIEPKKSEVHIPDLLLNKSDWKSTLVNDFEASIFPNHPSLANIKQELYNSGAYYAAMSGSGSTIFGLFDEIPEVDFPNCTVFVKEL